MILLMVMCVGRAFELLKTYLEKEKQHVGTQTDDSFLSQAFEKYNFSSSDDEITREPSPILSEVVRGEEDIITID